MNQNHKYEPVSLFWPILLVLMLVALAATRSEAQHECQGGHNCNDDAGVINAGSSVQNTIAGDSVRAFSLSGGDMDIDDCLATESFLFGIWQRTKPNYFCLADKAQAAGHIKEAARLRCGYMGVRRKFGGLDGCMEAMTFENEVVESPEWDALYNRYAQYADDEEEERGQLEELEMKVVQLEQQIEQAPAPVYVNRGADKDAQRRANSRKALKGEE